VSDRNGEIEKQRLRFESSLDDLRDALEEELGWAPRARRWAVPIVAGAVGLVAGLVLRRNLPRLRRRRRIE